MKTIRIECEGRILLPYTEMHVLQGDLKELSAENYSRLEREILQLGYSEPISIWQEFKKNDEGYTLVTNWICNGTQRWRVIKNLVEELGYECPMLPVSLVKADSLREAKLKVLALASQYGRVTPQGLYEFTHDLGVTIDEMSKSYSFPEIDFKQYESEYYKEVEVIENERDAEAVPELPKVAKCASGDLWTFGTHRLFCGDSTKQDALERLMGGKKADMVFTDPPYNHAGKNELVASPVSQAMQRLKESEWDKDFDFSILLPLMDSILSEDCSIYICSSWHLAGQVWDYYSTRSSSSGYCVWSKPNPMPSLMKRHWTWATELICYATRGKHVFNFPEEGHAKNVWEIQKSPKNDLHPTMKPIEVPERAILHSSNPAQIVLDLFLGSGSTLIACERTGRACYGMEIDPLYCDVVLKRWVDFTGQDPVRHDGVKWSELSASSAAVPSEPASGEA